MFRGVPNDPWEGGPNGFRGTTINPGFRVGSAWRSADTW